MRRAFLAASLLRLSLVTAVLFGWSLVPRDVSGQEPTFRTVAILPTSSEGLTGDGAGNLYVAERTGTDCPVWRVRIADGAMAQVGTIPGTCAPLGLAFDAAGQLHVLSSERVYRFQSGSTGPVPGVEVASGLTGANGIAFDRQGAMYVTDGGAGQGRVWRVSPSGEVQEAFRVQAMANDVNAVDGVGGVGRDVRSLPPGSIRITPTGRGAADAEGSQLIVANGVAFNPEGNLLYVADTARGAIWVAEIDASGSLLSPTGCDTTYPSNTLCMDSLLVMHPALAGADGIALDAAGNIWVTAQERNAVVVVSPEGRVTEIFRNAPDPETQLRNAGPLEFPTSPFLDGTTLCLVHTDSNRGDNSPPSAGELAPGGPQQGKISCMNEPLQTPGLPLPVQ